MSELLTVEQFDPSADFGQISARQFELWLPEIENLDSAIVLNRGMQYAQKLKTEGAASLNSNLIVGEGEAIDAYIDNFFKGNNANLALVSEYGAGKTEILAHAHKIIGGLVDLVYIQASPDMRANQLVGSSQAVEKQTVGDDGLSITETITGRTQALLHSRMQMAFFDEATRGNPKAMGAGSNIIGSRKLETAEGIVDLDRMEGTVFAFNPDNEAGRTSAALPGQIASRISAAAVLADPSNWARILEGMDDFTPTPENIKPIIHLPELHIGQAAVKHVAISGKENKAYINGVVYDMLHALRRNDADVRRIGEAPGRIKRQVELGARIGALTTGRNSVTEADINAAVAGKLTAELVANGIKDLDQVSRVIEGTLSGKYTTSENPFRS